MKIATNGKAASPQKIVTAPKHEAGHTIGLGTICPITDSDDSNKNQAAMQSEFTPPRSLTDKTVFQWDEDATPVDNYVELGQRLAACGDLFRAPQQAGGLLSIAAAKSHASQQILKATDLAPVIADRVRVKVFKNGKPSGSMPSSTHLNTMLGSEAFLQQFRALDLVTSNAMYLPEFQLTKCGYNDGGVGQRIYYSGQSSKCLPTFDAIEKFLDVMAFATESDRTNAVAAALTVMLRNFWPGAKPLLVVTSTKSHGGKDTVIDFAAGEILHSSISYERADWALQKNFVALVKQNPDVGVVTIENVRLEGGQQFASAFVERFVTDSDPVLYSTGVGDGVRQPNHCVLAVSTNFGKVSEDMMNRALPIHLKPIGDVAHRESPIGNPRLEYLPANRERIAAELRGMIEHWKPILVDGVSATHIEHDIPEDVCWDTIAFSRCGKTLWVSNDQGHYRKFDWLKPREEGTSALEGTYCKQIAFGIGCEQYGMLWSNDSFDVVDNGDYFDSEEDLEIKGLLHVSYVRSLESWVVIDRRYGLRLFDREAACFSTQEMPGLETMTMVSSDIDTSVVAVARTDGSVDLWHWSSLLPFLPVGASSLMD